MNTLEAQLGIDMTSPSQQRAILQAEFDAVFLRELVQTRRDLGLTQADVAEQLGISQASVAAFERYDNDPKLSTIRRYAHAVGVLVEHVVEVDFLHQGDLPDWSTSGCVVTEIRRRGTIKPSGEQAAATIWKSRPKVRA